MTLHISLTPELEGFINAKIAAGTYDNAAEVVRDAVQRMRLEAVRLSAWHAAIAKGEQDLDRGEALAYTPELLDNLTQAALSGRPDATHTFARQAG